MPPEDECSKNLLYIPIPGWIIFNRQIINLSISLITTIIINIMTTVSYPHLLPAGHSHWWLSLFGNYVGSMIDNHPVWYWLDMGGYRYMAKRAFNIIAAMSVSVTNLSYIVIDFGRKIWDIHILNGFPPNSFVSPNALLCSNNEHNDENNRCKKYFMVMLCDQLGIWYYCWCDQQHMRISNAILQKQHRSHNSYNPFNSE